MTNLIFVTGFWAIFFAVLAVNYFVFEKWDLYPKPEGILDQPPFNCRRCCTTWSMLGTYLSVAVLIGSFWFGFCGVLLTLGEYLALRYKERHILDYDD